MHHLELLDELEQHHLIDAGQKQRLADYEQHKPVVLSAPLNTLLFASLSAFMAGAGALVYLHIDTIGHTVLMILLALLTAACFAYAFYKGQPYSSLKVLQPAPYFDLILLLGCLLFVLLEGYVQYQFAVFGTRYGLAVFIPAALFMALAYRFDHQGVLSLGLTGLASWVGLTITSSQLLIKNDFSDPAVIYTAIGFGLVVVAGGWYVQQLRVKSHFFYTYLLLAGTLYLVACSAGVVTINEWNLAFGVLLGVGCWVFLLQARQEASLIFLLISVSFSYFGFTYLLFAYLPLEVQVYLFTLYSFVTMLGIVYFFLNYKKILSRPGGHKVLVP
jgi:hypothetical protein